jgi:hypothetical protein
MSSSKRNWWFSIDRFRSRVVLESGFAAVTAIHEVVNRAGIMDAEFADHGR